MCSIEKLVIKIQNGEDEHPRKVWMFPLKKVDSDH